MTPHPCRNYCGSHPFFHLAEVTSGFFSKQLLSFNLPQVTWTKKNSHGYMQRKKHHHHLKFYGAPEETQQPCPEIDSLKPNSKRPKLGLLPQKETRKYSNCIHFQVRTCCSCFREGKGQLSNHPWVLDLLYSPSFQKKNS